MPKEPVSHDDALQACPGRAWQGQHVTQVTQLLSVQEGECTRAYRIQERVVEADLVKVFAPHDLSGKDRIRDADHLHNMHERLRPEA